MHTTECAPDAADSSAPSNVGTSSDADSLICQGTAGRHDVLHDRSMPAIASFLTDEGGSRKLHTTPNTAASSVPNGGDASFEAGSLIRQETYGRHDRPLECSMAATTHSRSHEGSDSNLRDGFDPAVWKAVEGYGSKAGGEQRSMAAITPLRPHESGASSLRDGCGAAVSKAAEGSGSEADNNPQEVSGSRSVGIPREGFDPAVWKESRRLALAEISAVLAAAKKEMSLRVAAAGKGSSSGACGEEQQKPLKISAALAAAKKEMPISSAAAARGSSSKACGEEQRTHMVIADDTMHLRRMRREVNSPSHCCNLDQVVEASTAF